MNRKIFVALAICAVLAVCASVAAASSTDAKLLSRIPDPGTRAASTNGRDGARLDTLWIFDADFSTTTGDNSGWTVYDRSGTLASVNYWHHDDIRIGSYAHLGDRT